MGSSSSSKRSTRLVTSTVVFTLTDTAKDEPTETGEALEVATSGSSSFSSSILAPSSSRYFSTPTTIPGFKASATPFSLSAAPNVVTATQTVTVAPSSSSLSQTGAARAQTRDSSGLSQKEIIIISSAAAGGVLLALLAGFTFCLIRRRKRSKRARTEYASSSYGSPPADPFNTSVKGADMSQEKSYSSHYDSPAHEARRYMPENEGSALYYDGYASRAVGARRQPSQIILAPQPHSHSQRSAGRARAHSHGHGSTPLLHKTSRSTLPVPRTIERMESPIDPELDERRMLNARPMRADESPPSSASPLGAGHVHEYGYDESDPYGEYARYSAEYGDAYAYAGEVPSQPVVHPAVSLADATPSRAPVPVQAPVQMPAPAPAPVAGPSTATLPKPQQPTVEASSSFEYPSWLRLGLDSGAIASAASDSSVPVSAGPQPSVILSRQGSKKTRSVVPLAPIVIPQYNSRTRAATISTPTGREPSRTRARMPEPTTPLPTPPAHQAVPGPSAAPPAPVVASKTHTSIATRKSTKGRRSVKRGKAAYQVLDSPGPSPLPDGGMMDGMKRADSPGAYSDGGDSASMYSQVSASMYSQVSASNSMHAGDGRPGLELSDSTLLAFPLIMRQNPPPPPLPQSRAVRDRSSPSLSPSMSLPTDAFVSTRPRRDIRTMDAEADDTMTMRVAGLIHSRAHNMRGVAPPERTGSIVSHIERAGSIKPAFGVNALDDDTSEQSGGTRPLRIGAKARMARMKRAAAAGIDATGHVMRPLQDGTNMK